MKYIIETKMKHQVEAIISAATCLRWGFKGRIKWFFGASFYFCIFVFVFLKVKQVKRPVSG